MKARRSMILAVLLGLLVGFTLAAHALSVKTNPGSKQAAVHTAAVKTPPIVPFIRTGFVGMKGCPCPTVFQMQRALKNAGVRPKRSRSTGFYGKITAQQVAAFQRVAHIRPVTGRYGVKSNRALSKYYDKAGRSRLTQVATSRVLVARFQAITSVTAHAERVAGRTLYYSQNASTRSILPAYPRIPPATDCSGYVTWVYKVVGLPDPSGWSFHPAGWTGSLSLHGTVVSAAGARIGDLVFYGGGPPFGHVAIVTRLHPTLVSTHGHTGIQREPITYRPVSQVRRYF